MTHIFAFKHRTNEGKPILYVGADSEVNYGGFESEPNHQKLMVVDNKFIMGTGSMHLIYEAIDRLDERVKKGEKISTVNRMAKEIKKLAEEYRDIKYRQKQRKLALQEKDGLEFIICGKNHQKTDFEIRQIDCNGLGFNYTMFAKEQKPAISKKKNIAVAGSGSATSQFIVAREKRETLKKEFNNHFVRSQISYALALHTTLSNVAASVGGVNNNIQYGFMTLDNGITTLYPTNIKFKDGNGVNPIVTSKVAHSYLTNLFGEKLTSKNMRQYKFKANKLHSEYTRSLEEFKQTLKEAELNGAALGVHRIEIPDEDFEAYDETSKIISQTLKDREEYIVKFTEALLQRGDALKKYL